MQYFVKDYLPILHSHLKGLVQFLLESIFKNYDYLIGNSEPKNVFCSSV